ncbi:uncharacterized protein MYCGRDRAFT_86982 [Zymoseptoria tritici IPO323]|uniref:Uncharacterized protein n=1 Tax=Zymoseptoria tritici (strain CBS 115943 / IPO323) TaxID=336722 RepID=F9XEX1_ZYMTI|nr:uncharacterized protein MYCGRDRAFT_86982 [Zymoseptoria tritici IPO323]EGP85849.1 hypothetical protein MYCGRDRAFT_86982 [Zymoseptoria tritici IPO323]
MGSSIASSPCPASRLRSNGNLQSTSSAAPQHVSSTSQGNSTHDPIPSSCDDTTEAKENTPPERALPASSVMQSGVVLNADGKSSSAVREH